MDPNLILAALVLFIKTDVHHPATVKEKDTLALDIHTLGGNNAANGLMVDASQKPNGGDPKGDPNEDSKKDPKEVPKGDFFCMETFE